MAARFTYSRWDGTQKGFDVDAEALFDQLTDDLLYHGDVNSALRRLLQDGMTDRDGQHMQGLRELLERLRQERDERLDRFDLGGVYSEIADELNDIVDAERHAIDDAVRAAQASGDQRRQDNAQRSADDRNFQLQMLPNDLAGKVRELQEYDFESNESRQRFEDLMNKLRQQLTQQMVDQIGGDMQNMSAEDLQRMKDMMAGVNDMIERRDRNEDPGFEAFMQNFGDFFPENPQSLDELLEHMARRMAAMQAMLNSMSAEQRAQLQQLSDQLLDDMDLRWQMEQLGRSLQSMMPGMNWDSSYQFDGQEPMGMGQAMQAMQQLGDLDALENLLRNAANPAALGDRKSVV